MSTTTSFFDYSDADNTYEGYVARPEGASGATVLVCHAWGGQGDFEREAAERLAGLGYIGVALDVYGKGKRGSSPEENEALMTPLVSDRAKLQARLATGLEAAQNLDGVDGSKIAALGFCFGGLCVLDMARMGADIKAAISFHGLLGAADNLSAPKPKASVLALHGWDDPMATPDDVMAFSKEMSAANADWQLIGYGDTVHAFTNPAANDKANGMAFDPVVTRRAWATCDDLLAETLS